MRLLIVEDDPMFANALQKSLLREGYAVDCISAGHELAASMRSVEYQGVLLDLGLPDASGEDMLKTIRAHSFSLPVLVITARGGLNDRLHMLESGADDYIIKPVDLNEVVARVRAVTRRAQLARAGAVTLAHGPLRLQTTQRTATWNGEPVSLTKREFWLLELFVRKKQQVLSREVLEENLYGWGDEIHSNAVEVYVHRLRRKFDPTLIKTVRGTGYQLGSEWADDV